MTQTQRNKKILAAIKSETERGLVSKKVARDTLIKEGIYTVSGKLRKEFGGKRPTKKALALV